LILNVPTQLPARQHGRSTAVFSGVRPRPRFDPKLIRAVAEGKAWYERIGEFPTLRALAKASDATARTSVAGSRSPSWRRTSSLRS